MISLLQLVSLNSGKRRKKNPNLAQLKHGKNEEHTWKKRSPSSRILLRLRHLSISIAMPVRTKGANFRQRHIQADATIVQILAMSAAGRYHDNPSHGHSGLVLGRSSFNRVLGSANIRRSSVISGRSSVNLVRSSVISGRSSVNRGHSSVSRGHSSVILSRSSLILDHGSDLFLPETDVFVLNLVTEIIHPVDDIKHQREVAATTDIGVILN